MPVGHRVHTLLQNRGRAPRTAHPLESRPLYAHDGGGKAPAPRAAAFGLFRKVDANDVHGSAEWPEKCVVVGFVAETGRGGGGEWEAGEWSGRFAAEADESDGESTAVLLSGVGDSVHGGVECR